MELKKHKLSFTGNSESPEKQLVTTNTQNIQYGKLQADFCNLALVVNVPRLCSSDGLY